MNLIRDICDWNRPEFWTQKLHEKLICTIVINLSTKTNYTGRLST